MKGLFRRRMIRIIVDVKTADHQNQKTFCCLVPLFQNVTLVFPENRDVNSKTLEKAFETQRPDLEKQVPRFTDKRGFTFRQGLCILVKERGRLDG
jgi:hypothetical protein